jgi:hypothetical protein
MSNDLRNLIGDNLCLALGRKVKFRTRKGPNDSILVVLNSAITRKEFERIHGRFIGDVHERTGKRVRLDPDHVFWKMEVAE